MKRLEFKTKVDLSQGNAKSKAGNQRNKTALISAMVNSAGKRQLKKRGESKVVPWAPHGTTK